MKQFIYLSLVLAAVSQAAPVKYTMDTAHSEIGFKVSHLVISTVKGSFNKYDGSFEFDAEKNIIKNLKVNIDMTSVDTREPDRDTHLKKEDFFFVEKFPKATFVAKEVTLKDGKGEAKGTLTLRGKSQPLTLNVNYKGSVKDAWGNEKAVFEAKGNLNRKTYGVSWNKVLDNGGVTVGDEVELEISVQAMPEKKAEVADPKKKK